MTCCVCAEHADERALLSVPTRRAADLATKEMTKGSGEALPPGPSMSASLAQPLARIHGFARAMYHAARNIQRSDEHTSELQSPCNLVCRLLLAKKINTASRRQIAR